MPTGIAIATEEQQPETPGANTASQTGTEIVIENDSDLPPTYPHADLINCDFERTGLSVLHWRLLKGTLPPGMKLEDDGLLHGQAEHIGRISVYGGGDGWPASTGGAEGICASRALGIDAELENAGSGQREPD